MPFCFEVRDVAAEASEFKSVLIVPRRFCPAASTAVKNNEPYIEFPRRSLKTASYERLLSKMKDSFEERGITTGLFKSSLLHQFVLCMWTAKRRKKLVECAEKYEAVVVMGCEAAVATVRSALTGTDCHIIPGLRSEGIMSIQPKFSVPCNLRLELESVTPYVHPESGGGAGGNPWTN